MYEFPAETEWQLIIMAKQNQIIIHRSYNSTRENAQKVTRITLVIRK